MPNRRRDKIAVLGGSGHARSVAETAQASGFDVVAFVIIEPGEEKGLDRPAVPSLEMLNLEDVGLAIGVGINFQREAVYKKVIATYPTVTFPVIAHPSAWISSSAKLSPGSVIFAHASVAAKSEVGLCGLLNIGSSLDHDSTLGAFASLGPGARTGGNVTIGNRSLIGINAGILQGRQVGADSVVGGHSLVNRNIGDLTVAFGIPARSVKARAKTDPHF
jgi:sugar O-acyltransferase (sialic acid O-acetyltransferase NeuD family)